VPRSRGSGLGFGLGLVLIASVSPLMVSVFRGLLRPSLILRQFKMTLFLIWIILILFITLLIIIISKSNHDQMLLVLQIWFDSEPLRNVGRSHSGTGHGQ